MYCKHALLLSKEQFEEQKFKNDEDNDLEQYIFQGRVEEDQKLTAEILKLEKIFQKLNRY